MLKNKKDGESAMKIKKILIVITAMISLAAIGSTTTTAVQAKEKKVNVKVFPKKARGTWYHYDYTGQLVKDTLTRKKWISYYNGKRSVSYLHVQPKGGTNWNNRDGKKENWIYIDSSPVKVHGHRWVCVRGWYEMTAGPFFTVSTEKGHHVLTNAAGHDVNGAVHWYRTAKLAKKLRNKHYAHFAY